MIVQMDDINKRYTYCPKCGNQKRFVPNATYLCNNCGIKFYVKIKDTKAYISDDQKTGQFTSIQGKVDISRKIGKLHK